MKRLNSCFDASGAGRERSLAQAREFAATLSDRGYSRETSALVLQVLLGATEHRIAFEQWLRSTMPSRLEVGDLIRSLRAHLDQEVERYKVRIDPRPPERRRGLIIAKELLAALQAYTDFFLYLGDDEQRPSLKMRGRPGDINWLERPVLNLHAAFLKGLTPAPSESACRKLIHGAFAAAGHGDIATRELIRHILAPHPPRKSP